MSNVNEAKGNRDWWKKELEELKGKVREAELTLADREEKLRKAESDQKRDEQAKRDAERQKQEQQSHMKKAA